MRVGGQTPVPARLKALRGNPGQYPIKDEPQPDQADEVPEPPKFVKGYAAEEWRTVAPELHRLGLLTKIDLANLAGHCLAYKRWRQAEEKLARMAEDDPVMEGLLVEGVANPLIAISLKAGYDMLRFGSELGLSPVSRCRLGTPQQPKAKGKFDGLLARHVAGSVPRTSSRLSNV
jgi:P27 family predicted phage terminase small subunit